MTIPMTSIDAISTFVPRDGASQMSDAPLAVMAGRVLEQGKAFQAAVEQFQQAFAGLPAMSEFGGAVSAPLLGGETVPAEPAVVFNRETGTPPAIASSELPRPDTLEPPPSRPSMPVTGPDPQIVATGPQIAGTDPVKPGTGPQIVGTDPVKPGTGPQIAGTDPVKPGPAPQIVGTAPVKPGTAPQIVGTAPVKPGPAPQIVGTAPVNSGTGPQIVETGPVNPGTDPVKLGTGPVEPGTDPQIAGTQIAGTVPKEVGGKAEKLPETAVAQTETPLVEVGQDKRGISVGGEVKVDGFRPASEPEDAAASVVLQAAPIAVAPEPQVIDVRNVAVEPVQVVAARVAHQVAATPTQVLIEAASAVADTIVVSPGLLRGSGEIQVQLRPDVLEGTVIHISTTAPGALTVQFTPTTENMAALLEKSAPQLVAYLSEYVHNFQVAVNVKRDVKSKG